MNINRIFLLLIVMVTMQRVSGQEYFTQGASPKLHLTHTVAAKETWYSISRTFNLAAKEIASYNKLNLNKPLEIGQNVQIPLNSSNFTQDESKTGGMNLVPVYHVVQEKEWMYRISVNHNKVPIEKLEKWNNIKRDDAKAGTKLIVGYLKTNENATVAKAETAKPTEPASRQETAATDTKPAPAAGTTGGAGYFQNQYDNNGKNFSVVSGIFKSTSGWNDGKYYALMNNVTVGTIVKVNFPQTNKSIFAKVLGELPDMKESAGISLRISDAAARELGAVANKFSVEVMY